MAGPERPIELAFVDLAGDSYPQRDKEYDLIPASGSKLEKLPFPDSTQYKRLSLDLYDFYVEDLPDLFSSNEGMIKIQVNTRNPQNLNETPSNATFVTKFEAKDGAYAPTFLYRGVFRNVLFREWINLRIDLYELDTDAAVYYDRVKSVIDNVPEIKNLDVLVGIPYLGVATKLFEGIIRTFGKNPDDHIWGEFPTLELTPLIGGAFLRSGIYVLYEKRNKAGEDISVNTLSYKNREVNVKSGSTKISNHLIFGIRVRSHSV